MPRSNATAATPTPTAADPASYEAALAELEQLVERMEAGQLPLDQLLDNYKRGAQLLGYCRRRLQAVEQQVKVFDNGLLQEWVDDGSR